MRFFSQIIFLSSIIIVDAIIKTSQNPVVLDMARVVLRRDEKNNRTVVETGGSRSKPLLFQQVLGIVPNDEFEFDVEKWRALQSCGLFRNLSARTVMKPDGVALHISGVEGLSIKFSPQVTAGGTISEPEFTGGLVYSDRNFRGLGDFFEVLLFHKAHARSNELNPNWRVTWRDCSIGKDFRAGFEMEQDSDIHFIPNFIPLPPTILQTKEQQKEFQNWKGAVNQLTFKLSTAQEFVHNEEYIYSWNFEPFLQVIHSPEIDYNRSPVRTAGARFKINRFSPHQNGIKYSAWYENGLTSFPLPGYPQNAAYHHTGLEIAFPSLQRQIPPFWKKWTFLSQSRLDQPLSLLAKCRVNLLKSWGKGQIPANHGRSLSTSTLVRGFPEHLSRGYNSIHSLLNAKLDLYLENLPFGRLGLFADSAVYQEADQPDVKFVSSVGASFSSKGIRVDLGVPVHSWKTPRFYLGLDLEQ